MPTHIPNKILVSLDDGREIMYYATLFNFLRYCSNVVHIMDMDTGELLYIRDENYIAPCMRKYTITVTDRR